MKRGLLISLVVGLLAFAVGWFVARATSRVQEVLEEKNPPPPRTVSADWHLDRMSPGHSSHLINRKIECNACHDPELPVFGRPDPGVCTGCHMDQAALTHVGVGGQPTDCFECHAFKNESPAFGPWDCARCHGSFDTATHAGLAVHEQTACAHCHHPHEPMEASAKDCQSCHQQVKVAHGSHPDTAECSQCHGGHKLAEDARPCTQCHESQEPIVPQTATFARGHDRCESCHRAHDFSAGAALSCRSCHSDTVVLAQKKTRAHSDCASCHTPHAVRSLGASACVRCHSDVSSSHPRKQGKGECTSCHQPHPKRQAELALQCSHCHDEAHAENAFHAGKTRCTDCHQPHAFDLGKLAPGVLCVRCHATEIRLTSRLPAHSECQTCHQGSVHEPGSTLSCTSCHEEQHALSPEGHRDCSSCHEPHRAQASVSQMQCLSCHELPSLPGLHRLPEDERGRPGHSECSACHSVHEEQARADRNTCMSCHEGIADHEPDAKRCTGCHTFQR